MLTPELRHALEWLPKRYSHLAREWRLEAARRPPLRDELLKQIRDVQRLSDPELRRLLRVLREAQKRTIRELRDAETDWRITRLTVLRMRLERAMVDVAQELNQELGSFTTDRFEKGQQLADDWAIRFGGEAELLEIDLPRQVLAELQRFSADKVQDVPQSVIDRVTREVQQGMLSGQSPEDTIKRIGTELVDEDGNPLPGVWGTTAQRAITIWQTEAGRVSNAAADERAKQRSEVRPGEHKLWLWNGWRGYIDGRPEHERAEKEHAPDGKYGPVPADGLFTITVKVQDVGKLTPSALRRIGRYTCSYPQDPVLPAHQTVNCHCVSRPWRQEWPQESLRRTLDH